MKRRILTSVSVAVMTFTVSDLADATPLFFNFSGPSGTAAFTLDSNPTPDFSNAFLGYEQFGFNNVSGTFGGVAGTASTISFGNGIYASLNIAAPNLGFTQFSNPVLFTGSQTAPTFATGTFTLINPFFGNGTLTISSLAAAAPEPATWAMMILGFGIVGVGMRRRQRITTVVSYAR